MSFEFSPPAYFLLFQGTLITLTGLVLMSGFTDGLYKMEPHHKKISSRGYEKLTGGQIFAWGLGMLGAVYAGGAHIMCILQLIPMLVWTYFHYVLGGTQSMVTNIIFMAVAAYFGFVPLPEFSSIEWTPAAIFLTFQSTLVLLTAVSMLVGQTDGFYKFNPVVKEFMTRFGEIGMAGSLFGMAATNVAGLMAGGAPIMCLVILPGLIYITIDHAMTGAKANMIVNSIIIVIFAFFGVQQFF